MSKRLISIHIGQYHASRLPTVIRTVVGSCVAVCLYDPSTETGGMNHIFLPGKNETESFEVSARYGVHAMELLTARLVKLGADRTRLIAKAFGGANIFPEMNAGRNIGKRNSEFVISYLEKESIRLVSCNLGGTTGKKIFFHTDTGDVFLQHLKPSSLGVIVDEEMAAQKTIIRQNPAEIVTKPERYR
jgi:chemotaxis receptor (MCP) glutamine deamidase CheD